MPITVIAKLKTKPGSEAQFEAAARKMIESMRSAEPNTLQYVAITPPQVQILGLQATLGHWDGKKRLYDGARVSQIQWLSAMSTSAYQPPDPRDFQ